MKENPEGPTYGDCPDNPVQMARVCCALFHNTIKSLSQKRQFFYLKLGVWHLLLIAYYSLLMFSPFPSK